MIAKNCIHILLIPFLLFLFFLFYGFIYLSIPFLLLFFFFLFFFRDVPRKIEEGIISPADGRVMEAGHKISIFMSPFDMHVNLMPCTGKIISMRYHKGMHKPAYGNIEKNERMEIDIDSDIGKMKVVQIAGIFARRIVSYVKEGDVVKKGDKIGIVRFGSRVEVYLPDKVKITVKRGDKIKAGQTIGIL